MQFVRSNLQVPIIKPEDMPYSIERLQFRTQGIMKVSPAAHSRAPAASRRLLSCSAAVV